MKKTRSLHLLALMAIAPLSAQAAASARYNTAFAPNDLAGADPNINGGTCISDGAMITGGGSGTAAQTIEVEEDVSDGLHAKNALKTNLYTTSTLLHAAGASPGLGFANAT